jgi:photosystem II stability/assembly factor-like uncharacterized protein
MRKIILLISFFTIISSSANSQTGWYQQNSGTGYTLNSVFFLDSNTGYIVGDTTIGSLSAYIILKTTNGGLNWINQTPPFPNNLNALKSVFFLDAITGWACGGGNTSNLVFVIKTTNGGANWNTAYNQSGYYMQSLFFLNALTGIGVGGYNPRFFRTTDGGFSWSNNYLLLNNGPLTSVYFPDPLTGYAAGPDTNIFKTTNAGVNWSQIYYAGSNLNSIYFINISTGWMAGGSVLYITTNGGNNWLSNYLPINSLSSVRFVNDQTGWVCGSAGSISGSTNGGANWTLQATGITTYLYSLSFINVQTGWAVGMNGRILKTTTGGITYIQQISNEIPNEFKLYQNYPNPFNPTTNIKFQISKLSVAKIIIYDILGREVTTLVNEQLKPGTYEVEWNASNYPSGVYYYKLSSGEFSETRKAVLLK